MLQRKSSKKREAFCTCKIKCLQSLVCSAAQVHVQLCGGYVSIACCFAYISRTSEKLQHSKRLREQRPVGGAPYHDDQKRKSLHRDKTNSNTQMERLYIRKFSCKDPFWVPDFCLWIIHPTLGQPMWSSRRTTSSKSASVGKEQVGMATRV